MVNLRLVGSRKAFRWTSTEGFVDLGDLGGGRVHARSLNNAGQVVGEAALTTGEMHAFVWSEADGMMDLGTLGGTRSVARSINEAGQVAGKSQIETGEFHAFLWTAAGGMTDLGTLGGDESSGHRINDLGHMTGWAQRPFDGALQPTRAFFWTPEGGMLDLGTLGGKFSEARGINESDQIVGWSLVALGLGSESHAFLWDPSLGMQPLENLGGVRSLAFDLTETGEIVGYVVAAGGETGAVLWSSAGDVVDLGALTGMAHSEALGMSDSGLVAGCAGTSATEVSPYLWIKDLAILTTALPEGELGVPYASTLEIEGGLPAHGFSLSAGGLPDGLTLDPATGEITGTPDEGGDFAFSVEVVDALGTAVSVDLTLTVTVPPDVVAIVSAWWRAATEMLVVTATSTSGGSAILTVEGFGGLSYDAGSDAYRRAFRDVAANPGTVTVTSTAGGSDTAEVVTTPG